MLLASFFSYQLSLRVVLTPVLGTSSDNNSVFCAYGRCLLALFNIIQKWRSVIERYHISYIIYHKFKSSQSSYATIVNEMYYSYIINE